MSGISSIKADINKAVSDIQSANVENIPTIEKNVSDVFSGDVEIFDLDISDKDDTFNEIKSMSQLERDFKDLLGLSYVNKDNIEKVYLSQSGKSYIIKYTDGSDMVIKRYNGEFESFTKGNLTLTKDFFDKNGISLEDIKNIKNYQDKFKITLNNGVEVKFDTNSLSCENVSYNGVDIEGVNVLDCNLVDISNVTINDSVVTVTFNNGTTCDINSTDGKLYNLHIGNDVYFFDGNGNIINHTGETISIFNNENNDILQYGGDQNSFATNFEKLLSDPNICSILKEYFPNASYEDYELLFKKITNTGCGYVAVINCIFKKFEGQEQKFYQTFGYSMYKIDVDGNKTFNYEPLILEYYLNYWVNYQEYSIDEIYGNIESVASGDGSLTGEVSTGATGIPDDSYIVFDDYLYEKYGITLNQHKENQKSNKNKDASIITESEWKEYINEGYEIMYGSGGYDLYIIDPVTGERGELAFDDGGPHGMVITGFTDNGDIIVSSWGRKLILDTSNQEFGYYRVFDIDI